MQITAAWAHAHEAELGKAAGNAGAAARSGAALAPRLTGMPSCFKRMGYNGQLDVALAGKPKHSAATAQVIV